MNFTKKESFKICLRGLRIWYLLLPFLSVLAACSPAKKIQKANLKAYRDLVQNSPVFNRSFTGFQLFDPAMQQVLFSYNADKYFIPASNTKILTLSTALNILGDSIPALRYVVSGDSLIFWGTGDPSFYNPYFSQNETVVKFLKDRKEQLFFCSHNFQDERFGPGWAWDDYYFSYQPEKSSFPFFGNMVWFEKEKMSDSFDIRPAYFAKNLTVNDRLNALYIKRKTADNTFEFNPALLSKYRYKTGHPFKYSDELLVSLLSDTLEKKVDLWNADAMPPADAKVVFSVAADTLYRRLMQESDNFIAEQLLLLCANDLFDTLNVPKTIRYAKDSLLTGLPDQINWVDGSGLSRYNLLTPRSVVYVLNELSRSIPRERLFHIFPAGGQSGTIATRYAGEGQPYIFAKTGTLRNNHCLSGYLVAKSGKVLIFSFMHNNFPGSSNGHKDEMEKVLKAIYLAY